MCLLVKLSSLLRRTSQGVIITFALLIATSGFGQISSNRDALLQMSSRFSQNWDQNRSEQYYLQLQQTDGPLGILNRDNNIELIGVLPNGRPLFFKIDNLNAAQTISTNLLWPEIENDYSLNGSTLQWGQLGIWDAGCVLVNHQELVDRVVQVDGCQALHDHATHVAGTMVAAGISNEATGMSYSGLLNAFDWSDDEAEMATAAANGLLISNHSYSLIVGWYYNSDNSTWYWYGDPSVSETEDGDFGRYTSLAADWDEIAYNAPYLSIVKSAGNDRIEYPGENVGHYVFQNGDWQWSTLTRDPDGGDDGYDCLPPRSTAKNIFVVGAVNDIPEGYQSTSDVIMTSFSSWGPTDDGRIKPDIVANGVGLYSCSSASTTSYTSKSGTSMSAPNVAGSLGLLIELYASTHQGQYPLASTLKAVIIQTADECGETGPDYQYGWGLMNSYHSADLISADVSDTSRIITATLQQNLTLTYFAESAGIDPIKITVAWTDPPGDVPIGLLNPTDPTLVNDLDISAYHFSSETSYQPYVLDPAQPQNPATFGDNDLDNVEQVYIESPEAGRYRFEVNHEGILEGNQVCSIVISGLMVIPDPRIPPENLIATLDSTAGTISLVWNHVDTTDTFIEYTLYRNDIEVLTTADSMFVDTLADPDTYNYYVTASYVEGESLSSNTETVQWFGFVSPFEIELLPNFYNLISFHCLPLNLETESVFQTVESLIIVYENDGSIYIPSTINTIGDVDIANGYRVACTDQDTISLLGCPIDPTSVIYPLSDQQWNWIGNPYAVPNDVELAFAEIEDQVVIVQAATGGIWIPDIPVNTIGNLTPGMGYMIVVAEPINFAYPSLETGPYLEFTPPLLVAEYEGVTPTGLPYNLIIDLSEGLWAQSPDRIEVFDGNALVGGTQIEFQENPVVVTCWEESSDLGLSGFTTGNEMSLSLLDSEGCTIDMELVSGATVFGEGYYSELAFVDQVNSNSETATITEFRIGSVYPNPMNSHAIVQIDLPEAGSVELSIYNILGEQIESNVYKLNSGIHSILLFNSLNHTYCSGVYFIRVCVSGQISTQKIIYIR